MSSKLSAEEEARLKRQVLMARIGLVVLIVVLLAVTIVIPELAGFRTYVVIFGIGGLLTSGSIAEQVKYRAWRKKVERR
jgi:hypothetical protein